MIRGYTCSAVRNRLRGIDPQDGPVITPEMAKVAPGFPGPPSAMELIDSRRALAQALAPWISVLHVAAPARHEVAAVARAATAAAGVGARGGAGDLSGLLRGVERRNGRDAVAVDRQRDRVGQAEVLRSSGCRTSRSAWPRGSWPGCCRGPAPARRCRFPWPRPASAWASGC